MKISESGRLDGAQPLAEPPAAPRVDLAAPAATRQTHSDVAHMSPPVPASLEAEQGVLGCCLLDARAVTECAARLRSPEAFYDLRHREVYETLVGMVDAGKPVDLYTVQVALKSKGVLDGVGGLEFLGGLQDATPSAANLEYYLAEVEQKFTVRLMLAALKKGHADLKQANGEAHLLIDRVEQEVLAVRRFAQGAQAAEGVKALVVSSVAEIERLHQSGGAISGMATGFTDLDKMLDGLHQGELVVVAAHTGQGKTALMMNIAEHAVLEERVPVGVFSLEMTAKSLVLRMLCSRARVNLRGVRDGRLLERDFPKLTAAALDIANSKLFVEDIGGLSIGELRARARRMVQNHGVRLLVVDYIQKLNGRPGRREENRQQEVADVASGLKDMAKELGVPVLTASQLSDDGRLRESRAIGQEADVVALLKHDEQADENGAVGVWVDIEKQRNGPTGRVRLTFLRAFTRFESAARVADEDVPQ